MEKGRDPGSNPGGAIKMEELLLVFLEFGMIVPLFVGLIVAPILIYLYFKTGELAFLVLGIIILIMALVEIYYRAVKKKSFWTN